MAGVNNEWALGELFLFLEMTRMCMVDHGLGDRQETVANNETVVRQWEIVERILNKVTPGWERKLAKQGLLESPWLPARFAALRAYELLKRSEEIDRNLGDNEPKLSVNELHPWIWEGASSLWQSNHYRAAVETAIKKLNAETQNKIGCRKLSETKLFQEVFSTNPPKQDTPRLRFSPNDGSISSKSRQEGALAFAKGIFLGIRNPLAHESDIEMTEQEALEYLAALSILARWVDESEVVVAS